LLASFYEICLDDVLGQDWTDCYAGLQVHYENDASGAPARTILTLPAGDQATLFGLLSQIGGLNLKLVLVRKFQANPGEV